MNQFASGYTGMGNNPVNMVDPDGQLAFAALAGGIMLKGVTVTASALTAGALVKGAALMAGKFALATAASSIASGIGGAGCCPGVRGSYNNPIGSGGELEHDVYGYIPGNVPYQGVNPMAPVSPVASQGMNALQGVQMLGDVASFVPGLNVVGGLTSAGASLAMGNYGAAAFAAATAIPVAGVALKVGKAALAGVRAARASKRIPLYRAVSQAELDDIALNGIRNLPGYETGKLFAGSVQDATNFGRLNYRFDKLPFTIIKTSIPKKYGSMLYRGEMDLMQGISVPRSLFNRLSKPTHFNYTPLPNHPWIR
jgi:hypothetical protein